MTSFRAFTDEDAVAVGEQAFSAAEGHSVCFSRGERLGGETRRNIIVRTVATEPGGAPRPVIVKATRAASYDADAEDAFETSGFVKEWAALSLLNERPAAACPVPRLLAADTRQGVLVIEDAGGALPSLVRPLLEGSAAEAEAALTAYATALARLHAATGNCRADYVDRVRTAFPATRVKLSGQEWTERVARPVAVALGGTLPEPEMALLADRLRDPGPWLALVHRDPCPDNVLLAANGEARLIDFEFAAPGHALLDAAYWRLGFPTCWCAGTVPDAVATRLDHAYRTALALAVPAAADEAAFRRESAVVAGVWLFDSLAWLLPSALGEDRRWGLAGNRSRIHHYLAAAADRMAAAGVLPDLHHMVGRWRAELGIRWADAGTLAPYPAFARPSFPA